MTRKVGIVAFLIAVAAASAGAIAANGDRKVNEAAVPERSAQAAAKKPVRYEDHDLFIETNATDGDAGLQLNLDGEDWRRTKILDPRGRKVLLDVKAKGRLRAFGLTELFFEASEPPFTEVPFSEFKRRFPEGKYTFRGRTVEGDKLVASDRLTHVIPAAPKVTFPTEGSQADPNGFTITWEPVTRPSGVEITSYIVLLSQPSRDLEMEVPGTATGANIPGGLLKPGTRTGLEVLSKEKSGNQTITAVSFRTS
jgi:hypothetical protein